MNKKDIQDALGAYNVQWEEMKDLTAKELGAMLSDLNKKFIDENKPEKPDEVKTVEITRSYSRKVNLGNYESEDHFCSRKAETTEDDDIRQISNWLLWECKVDVLSAIEKNLRRQDEIAF